jgi:hypothetical protein
MLADGVTEMAERVSESFSLTDFDVSWQESAS